MSSWRDFVRAAEFRGVPFDAVELSSTSGRRRIADELAENESLPPTADLGPRRPGFRMRGLVGGDDYLDKKERLLAALNAAGPGELVHPWRGRVLVQVGEVSDSHDLGHGVCYIEFDAVLHGGQARPFVAVVPAAQAQAQVDLANAGSAAHYGVAGKGNSASLELDFLYSLVDFGTANVNDFIVTEPGKFLGDLNEWNVPFATAYAQLLKTTEDVSGLLQYLHSAAVTVWHSLGTTSGTAREESLQALADGMRLPALIRVVQLAIGATYVTADEADETMATLALELSDRMDDIADLDLFVTLSNLRTTLVDALSAVAERLPRERSIVVPLPTPALIIAFDTYGPRRLAARERELVRLNNIGHPGFVSGDLKVLSK